ncbi:aldose epimerase family protein [Planococcus sp. YIM B11945]|uniref:aldose epimerase family protein n=1 Tax=Planococcus sp. YIM B11945 TaxID=3435410 RepID=UPI003D7DAECE
MEILEKHYGDYNGQAVKAHTLRNKSGMEITCIDFGCIITEWIVPDQNGIRENVVLGFDSLEEYIKDESFFGAVIGRISGRIENAEFSLDGNNFVLAQNDGDNHIHGGPKGFHRRVWASSAELQEDRAVVAFSYTSPDGEEGFPGKLETVVTYTLNEQNELTIAYRAQADKKTLVNLTNHTYFNLSGDLKRDVLNHELTINSDQFLELDQSLVPTGQLGPVENTVFDFRNSRRVGEGMGSNHPQIQAAGGYDHPYLLGAGDKPQIVVADPESGRRLEVKTDQPAVVFYSGNNLSDDGTIRGRQFRKHLGLCLETQLPPGSVDAILPAGEVYETKTVFAF